jgi:hypothetical protein
MLKAARTGLVPFRSHLEKCETCRALFTLLSRFPLAGQTEMARPPSDTVDRYALIPLLSEPHSRRPSLTGSVCYDSWAHRPAPELRDIPLGSVRRIRLEARPISFEVVAERRQDGWDFVARVYRANEVTSEFVLRIGSRSLLPRSQGYYHWSSKRTPRAVRLLSRSLQVKFEDVSW